MWRNYLGRISMLMLTIIRSIGQIRMEPAHGSSLRVCSHGEDCRSVLVTRRIDSITVLLATAKIAEFLRQADLEVLRQADLNGIRGPAIRTAAWIRTLPRTLPDAPANRYLLTS